MKLTDQDRQFIMGVLGIIVAVALIVTDYIDPALGLGVIGAILAAYGYGEAQLKREPPR